MGRAKWLLAALVCAAHLLLITGLFSSAGTGRAVASPTAQLALTIVSSQTKALYPAPAESGNKNASTPPPTEPPAKSASSGLPVQNVNASKNTKPEVPDPLSADPFSLFKRDKFLDISDLDEPAAVTNTFEAALNNVLPARFNSVSLEFLIDETGQTVQLICLEGDCTPQLVAALNQLIVIPFTPATKNGQAVASRKVIQIVPLPNFGL